MPVFNLDDFISVLSAGAVLTSAIGGVILGLLLRRLGFHLAQMHAFIMVMGGLVFFAPVSIVRAYEGSTVWEKLLATWFLWIVFAVGMWLGTSIGNQPPES